MNDMELEQLCKDALEVFGAEHQTKKLFEEMAELQKELCKMSDGESNVSLIAEEIADVFIVLFQMITLYNCADKVDAIGEYKLERLKNKIQKRREEIAGKE